MQLTNFSGGSRATVALVEFDPHLPPGQLSFDHVIFLDFDGVLHGDGSDRDAWFCFVPDFCAVMRAVDPRAEVPIVISSMWRFDESIAKLRAHFPGDIARQIVGVTLDLSGQGAWEAPQPWSMHGGHTRVGTRQRECVAWMQAHAPAGQWLAIDDRASYFVEGCPNLFKVPGRFENEGEGLNSSVAKALMLRLQAFLVSNLQGRDTAASD